MARPTQNVVGSPWSLTQIAKRADITMRTARTLVDAGWLPRGDLTLEHAVIARVAAALLDAPRPSGVARGGTTADLKDRNHRILDQVWRSMTKPDPGVLLLVSATDFFVSKSMSRLSVFLEDQDEPEALLLLPIGHWAQQVMQP